MIVFLSRRIEQNWTGVHNAQAIEIKKYAAVPVYYKLYDYFTLSKNDSFVKYNGKIETWWYRELICISESYEENFYEVASYYVLGKSRGLTHL